MCKYEAIEDRLTEVITSLHYTEIEEFLGYPISSDVLEHLEDIIREALDEMSEDELWRCEEKYLNGKRF